MENIQYWYVILLFIILIENIIRVVILGGYQNHYLIKAIENGNERGNFVCTFSSIANFIIVVLMILGKFPFWAVIIMMVLETLMVFYYLAFTERFKKVKLSKLNDFK